MYCDKNGVVTSITIEEKESVKFNQFKIIEDRLILLQKTSYSIMNLVCEQNKFFFNDGLEDCTFENKKIRNSFISDCYNYIDNIQETLNFIECTLRRF